MSVRPYVGPSSKSFFLFERNLIHRVGDKSYAVWPDPRSRRSKKSPPVCLHVIKRILQVYPHRFLISSSFGITWPSKLGCYKESTAVPNGAYLFITITVNTVIIISVRPTIIVIIQTEERLTRTSTMSWTCLLMVCGSGGLSPATQSANMTGFVGVDGWQQHKKQRLTPLSELITAKLNTSEWLHGFFFMKEAEAILIWPARAIKLGYQITWTM